MGVVQAERMTDFVKQRPECVAPPPVSAVVGSTPADELNVTADQYPLDDVPFWASPGNWAAPSSVPALEVVKITSSANDSVVVAVQLIAR
jgi:hypothetical protein